MEDKKNYENESTENISNNEKNEEVDNRTFSEKFEDKLDDIMGGIQDFFYGKGDNYSEDIPATMEMSNGIRKINKVQTRRNILKRIFKRKK